MKKVRVMIVDDSKMSRVMLSDNLKKTNFVICAEAKNSVEAVKLYAEMQPDVVTMDMNLPDADGIECTRRIREFDKDAKIVMVSAMKDASLITRGREAGIGAFLQKPVTSNDLIDALLMLCQPEVSLHQLIRESYVKPFVKALQTGIFDLIRMPADMDLASHEHRYLEVSGIAVILGLTGNPVGRAIMVVDAETMKVFAGKILQKDPATLSEDDASDTVEEAANIIVGRGVSAINDAFKESEMRITPPGTIVGQGIRIASPKLSTYRITAKTQIGNIYLNVGFAEGE